MGQKGEVNIEESQWKGFCDLSESRVVVIMVTCIPTARVCREDEDYRKQLACLPPQDKEGKAKGREGGGRLQRNGGENV
ncbi:hypothetical protein E2C01_037031 [Portunus trituberculatus]|uniref:Uncharacterized protein n=1 Tax=Portunus trituberculatus TaxID=210409 RepID=A0A5B7FDJ2_PORTR|nr:hypothetical protein [Portunus trituberculatus]